jgi:T4-like virus Myoviridae tail sheath stabiliser
MYAAKEKTLVRLNADPDLDRETATIVPMLSFELRTPGLVYDANRKLPSTGRKVIRHPDDKNKFKTLYNPVPYDLKFNLYIYVKFQEDGTRILEQILPFFTPDWTVSMELVPEMNEIRDVPTVLESVMLEDIYDGDFKKRRMLIWTLSFTMHGWIFGPVKPKPIIKFTQENFRVLDSNTFADPIVSYIVGQPGVDANGQPTTNIAASIDYTLIDVNDDYGFAHEVRIPVGQESANQDLLVYPPDGSTRKYDDV